MIQTASSTTLRHRAAALRALATTIEGTPAMSLEQLSGDDTWRGDRPLLCHNVLVANLAQLHASVEDLRAHAWNLDQQAHALEISAAVAGRSLGTQAG